MSNVYDVLNKELERLHETARVNATMDPRHYRTYHPELHNVPYREDQRGSYELIRWAINRIEKIQEMMMKSYQANDQELQQRIAEFALIGNPAEEKIK